MLDATKASWDLSATVFASALLEPDVSVPAFLTSTSSGNDPRRFAVYRNNVTVGLVRAMEANFPSIVRLVGHEYFSQLARLFVQDHPPRTRMLFEYGAEFAGFLEAFTPLRDYPYLGDVARIEQAWREAFHETDVEPLQPVHLTDVPSDAVGGLILVAHSATRLLPSRFAAGSIFVANREDGGHSPIDPLRSEWTLVTRPAFDCAVRILTPAQGQFTQCLLAGSRLNAAATTAFDIDSGFDLSAAIAGVIHSGAFAGFRLADNHQEEKP